MKILYNFPSRSRPKAFFEVLDNIRDMSASENYIVLAKLDNDDPELSKYLESLTKYPSWQSINYSRSKVHAINRDIPENGWDILVNISDDQRFTVKGFDNIIRENIKGVGFLHFPDAYKKAACSVMSIISREFWLQTKHVYHPSYKSLWCDVEATELAKLENQYRFVPMTIFEHRHYCTGAPKDALYKRNDTYRMDGANYQRRRAGDYGLLKHRDPFLLIKYPTRGRWRLFSEGIDNIYSTIKTNRFKIVVSADEDDVEMNCPEVMELCKRYHNVELNYGPAISKIDACNRDIHGAWDWCVLYSDDMRFKEFGWDENMLKDIRTVWPEGFDWFAHFNDGYVGHKLPTLNVCGRAWYDRFGYLYHPSYKSVSCDAENMYVAQMLGRYAYFDNVYFNHDHPANLKQPSDYIYRRNHAFGDADTSNYFERMRNNFGLAKEYTLPEELKQYV